MERPPDIIKGLLVPGSVTTFSGPSHGGKSTLLAQLVGRLQRGEKFFELETRKPAHIFYMAFDHRWDGTYSLLFDRVGCDVAHWSTADLVRKKGSMLRPGSIISKSLGGPAELLDRFLKLSPQQELEPDTLLILDPLQALISNINSYRDVSTALTDLTHWAGDRWATVLGTAHTSKISSDPAKRYVRAVDRVAGSTAYAAYSYAMLNLATPEETGKSFSLLTAGRRTAPAVSWQIVRGADGLFEFSRAVADPHADPMVKYSKAALKILEMIPRTGTITLHEVAAKAERTPQAVYQQLAKLGDLVHNDRGVLSRRES